MPELSIPEAWRLIAKTLASGKGQGAGLCVEVLALSNQEAISQSSKTAMWQQVRGHRTQGDLSLSTHSGEVIPECACSRRSFSHLRRKTMPEKLKPCPFCGGDASMWWIGGRFGAGCENGECNTVPATNGDTEQEAATRWNQRSDSDIRQVVGLILLSVRGMSVRIPKTVVENYDRKNWQLETTTDPETQDTVHRMRYNA